MPNEKYIYYADVDNLPYGTKPKDEVIKYIKKAIEFFISQNVKSIVIACNTATSIAIEDLRNQYNIPIIGIEPAIKPALENRNGKKVLLMATENTIKLDKLNNLLVQLNSKEYVTMIAMTKLVEFAEKLEFNSNNVKEYIKEQIKQYNLEDYSYLVLGCTHFPLFREILREIFPKNVKIIDGSIGVAKRLKSILEEKNLLGDNKLIIDYYNSGRLERNTEKFEIIEQI